MSNAAGINNNFFSQNISFLKSSYPSLYRNIHAVGGMPLFEQAKNGGLTIKIEGVYVESRFDPQGENRQLFENIRTRGGRFFVFLGTGLGYHINFLLEDERARGILVEESREIFRASLFIILPGVLRRLVPFVGVDPDRLAGEIGALWTEDAVVVSHRRSMQGRVRYYSRAGGIIKNRIRETAASRLTEEKTKKLWLKNVLKNCASACAPRSSDRTYAKGASGRGKIFNSKYLGSQFAGAAVLVASGPFLEEADDRLRELGEKMPVISLLPSVSYLVRRGITPDFVVSTDAGFWNRYRLFSALTSLKTGSSSTAGRLEERHFRNEEKTSDIKQEYTDNNSSHKNIPHGTVFPSADAGSARIPLIAALSVDGSIIRMWPGDVYVFTHGLPVEMEMKKTASRLLTVPMQGTSAIVMILIARIMGFSPLYLAGFDFAVQGLKDHHRGAGFDEYLDARTSRFETRHTFAAERLRGHLPIVETDGTGSRIFTTPALKLYRNWLEQELDLNDLLRLNRGLPVAGLKEEYPYENRSSFFKTGGGSSKGVLRPDEARARNRHASKTLKQECAEKLTQCTTQELDRNDAAADLVELRKKISGYMKAHTSNSSAASTIYRIFYGEMPAGLEAEEMEREVVEAVQVLDRACRMAEI